MLRIPNQPPLSVLRDFLFESGYDAAHLGNELGLSHGLYANFANLEPLLERTSDDTRLAVLARLFFVAWPASQELCRKHIPDHVLQLCLDANVLALESGMFASSVALMPFENCLFASDAPRLRGSNPNVIIGPSASTNLLARASVRTRTSNVLDIGTGTGALAVIAAGYSDHVIGTDINERAIEFGRFNAALNGVHNVDFVLGDALSPIEGKKFSCILANPPFFPSAVQRFAYSDSPLELDGFTRKVAVEAPQYLEDGGVFQMLCEWVQVEGQPWEQRLRSWTAASGCDILLMLGPKMTAADYSEKRFHEAATLYQTKADTLMTERLNYLRSHQVEYVLSGLITMRKRAGANWFVSIPGDLSKNFGAAIQERMDSLTFLSRQTPEQWLGCKFRFAPDAIIRQTSALGERGWEVVSMEVSKPNGIGAPLKIDSPVLRTIEMFDGARTLGEIIVATAEVNGISPEESSARCVTLAKRLVQGSFIVPVKLDSKSSQQ